MKKTIGDIVTKLRTERGYTQKELARKMCTANFLSKIEQDENMADYFLLDRLFGRLGHSVERLEYVLPGKTYEIYEMRYRIQTALLYYRFEEAERLLNEYERKNKKDFLHRQFTAQERAELEWMRGGQTETILNYLNEAISETIPTEEAEWKNTALSAGELKLLLFRWEVCSETPYRRNVRELWELLDYMEGHVYDGIEEASVYPYLVILLTKYAGKRMEQDEIQHMAEKALELLRREGRMLFMAEILELCAGLAEGDENQKECVRELREMRETLLEIEEEAGVHYEKYPLFHYLNRTFELDYEVIKKTREARKMPQEKVCENICGRETISRIERGKCTPNNQTLERLTARLGRTRKRIEMNIAAEKYEQIALEREVTAAIYKHEYEKTEELFRKLKNQLDMSELKNQQYVKSEQLRIDMRNHKYSVQEAVEKFYEILQMTLSDSKENIFAYNLSSREIYILNQIAILFCKNKEEEKGIEIWRKILENYQNKRVYTVFYIRNWELITGNVAGSMEELNYVQEPNEICIERLKLEFESGKGDGIGRSLSIIACVLEHQNDKRCVEGFRKALNIYKLMKHDYRYQCLKEYVEEKGISIKS